MSIESFTRISQIGMDIGYALMLALLVVSCLKLHWPTKAKLILAGCWLLGIWAAGAGVLVMNAGNLLYHRAGWFSDAFIFWLVSAVFFIVPPLKFRRYYRDYLTHGSSGTLETNTPCSNS